MVLAASAAFLQAVAQNDGNEVHGILLCLLQACRAFSGTRECGQRQRGRKPIRLRHCRAVWRPIPALFRRAALLPPAAQTPLGGICRRPPLPGIFRHVSLFACFCYRNMTKRRRLRESVTASITCWNKTLYLIRLLSRNCNMPSMRLAHKAVVLCLRHRGVNV